MGNVIQNTQLHPMYHLIFLLVIKAVTIAEIGTNLGIAHGNKNVMP